MQHQLSTHQMVKIRRHRVPPTTLQIGIIVRTKNRPHLLTRCLQSLTEQKRQPDEIIVVNDGGIAIDEVINNFSALNIQLINNETNQGRAHAGNQGVQAAKTSDVIGFLDDDDRFLSDHLQRLEKAMLHFDAKVVYAGCRLLKRDMLGDKVILQEEPIGQFNDPFNAEHLRYENYIPLINLLIDRNLWLKVGGFDESFDVFEDWDVLLRLSKQTPFYHVNRITTEYAIWGGTQITQNMAQKRWRDTYHQFLQKHLLSLPEPDQLEYLAEYWRISQERRGILQEFRLDKQALQSQLEQTTQTLEQYKQSQQRYEEIQSDYTQLQSDWTTKYHLLQSDYAQLQSDWTTKYEHLQSDYNHLQSDWIAKYEHLQADYAHLQSNWIDKYEHLQADYAYLHSDWTAKYQQLQLENSKELSRLQLESRKESTRLQSDYAQLQSDWIAKYEHLQLESNKESSRLQFDWTEKYQHLQADYAQLQSDWTAKYQQLQSDYTQLQSGWIEKYQQLQSGCTQLQSDWIAKHQKLESDHAQAYDKLQSACEKKQAQMIAAHTQLEALHTQLQKTAQQEQNTLHELYKQMAVGLNANAIEKILQSSPQTIYTLTASSDGVISDYQRLAQWIRDKTTHLSEFERNLAAQVQPLYTNYHPLRQQITDLIQLISASRWPQIRRYANAVQDIGKNVENLFFQMEHYISSSNHIGTEIGLATINEPTQMSFPNEWENAGKIPPPRPSSTVYPTITTIAGTPEKPQFMDSIDEIGTVPFILDTNVVLVFTVHCTLDNFFRFDLFFGTCLRINTCQVRVIIRELESKTPIRGIEINALEIFDNRFHPIHFEPITDSAGKTYQIEIDSPDANANSGVAIWCHSKQPSNYTPLDYNPAERINEINELPQWMQQNVLDSALPSQLQAKSAPHLFMIFGLTESTHQLNLLIFLKKLGHVLTQANSNGQIVICGQFNSEVQHYCQQHQLTTFDTTQVHIDLPAALDWATNQNLSAKYLWCCELNAIPQPDIIERANEIFADRPDAGLLVPMEKYSDDKIRAGYASLVREGILETALAGAPADHPYYGYRRTVDAASSQLVILKRDCLSQLDIGEIGAYHIPMYQLTELIWQLKEQQYTAIYEGALCYEHSQPYPELPEQDYNHDCQYFYQRWADKIPTKTALFSHQQRLLNPLGQPTVLVIDATLPMYDEDSGSLRLYTLLKLWVSLGYRITFFPDNLDSQFKYRHPLEALGIEVFHGNYRIADAMAYRQFDFALICRVEIGQRYIPFVRLLFPKTVILYDTVDIHYIREQRHAEIENDPELLVNAQETKRKELANCIQANRVITVTQEDGYHLQQELPNLEFSVLPNIHQQHPLPENDFEQRDGLVFIGNYNHLPNQDAVYYFIETVLPKIRARLPDVCLYLIGSYMNDQMKALASETVKVVGWVDKVEPEFAKRRVFVSYLRYGAGMKGKLGQALSLGLPVVTTGIGAEGMGLKEEETALIADEPEDFAEAVCRLYTESTLWKKLSRQGRDYIEAHYGETAVRDKLRDVLACYQ